MIMKKCIEQLHMQGEKIILACQKRSRKKHPVTSLKHILFTAILSFLILILFITIFSNCIFFCTGAYPNS